MKILFIMLVFASSTVRAFVEDSALRLGLSGDLSYVGAEEDSDTQDETEISEMNISYLMTLPYSISLGIGLNNISGNYERTRQAEKNQFDFEGASYRASIMIRLFKAGNFEMAFKYMYEEANINFKFENQNNESFVSSQYYGVDFQHPVSDRFLVYGGWGIKKRSLSSISFETVTISGDDIFPNRGSLNLSVGLGFRF